MERRREHRNLSLFSLLSLSHYEGRRHLASDNATPCSVNILGCGSRLDHLRWMSSTVQSGVAFLKVSRQDLSASPAWQCAAIRWDHCTHCCRVSPTVASGLYALLTGRAVCPTVNHWLSSVSGFRSPDLENFVPDFVITATSPNLFKQFCLNNRFHWLIDWSTDLYMTVYLAELTKPGHSNIKSPCAGWWDAEW